MSDPRHTHFDAMPMVGCPACHAERDARAALLDLPRCPNCGQEHDEPDHQRCTQCRGDAPIPQICHRGAPQASEMGADSPEPAQGRTAPQTEVAA